MTSDTRRHRNTLTYLLTFVPYTNTLTYLHSPTHNQPAVRYTDECVLVFGATSETFPLRSADALLLSSQQRVETLLLLHDARQPRVAQRQVALSLLALQAQRRPLHNHTQSHIHNRTLYTIQQQQQQQQPPFNGLFSRTTWVSRYQKDKISLDLNGARDDRVMG